MTATTVDLRILAERFAVCRLDPDAAFTVPAATGSLYCLARTPDELSLVCQEDLAPNSGAEIERGWSALVVAGPLDFALTGILAAIAGPLAAAGVPIFAVSTYDTDYVLVRTDQRDAAITTLTAAGHRVTTPRVDHSGRPCPPLR